MKDEELLFILFVVLPILFGIVLATIAIVMAAKKRNASHRTADRPVIPPPVRSTMPPPAASPPALGTVPPVPGMPRSTAPPAQSPAASAQNQIALLYSAFPDGALRKCSFCGCENGASAQRCDACGEKLQKERMT